MPTIRSTRSSIALALGALALATSPASAAGTRAEAYPYIGGGGDAVCVIPTAEPKLGGTGIGCVTFDVLRGDQSVTIRLDDASGAANVGGGYRFRRTGDTAPSITPFCGSVTLDIPEGAETIQVYMRVATAPALACGGSPATRGVARASYVTE